jgi:hypothetical protein
MIPAHTWQPGSFPLLRSLLVQPVFLVRPQLLVRLQAGSRAGHSRRLLVLIDRSCLPVEDGRLSAGILVSQLFSKG